MTLISLDVQDGVAELMLRDPARRNALTASMAAEMLAAFAEVNADRSIRVLVVCGEDGWFCAGADRAESRAAQPDPALTETFAGFNAVYETFVALAELPIPT